MEPMLVAYKPPFAWDRLLQFLGARAVDGVERCDGNSFVRAVRLGDVSGVIEVRNIPGESAVRVDRSASLGRAAADVEKLVRTVFDLDADPVAIADVLRGDPLLAPLVDRFPGIRVPGAWDPFELALRAVIGQQISVAAARGMLSRVARTYGPPLEAPCGDERSGHHPDALRRTFPAPSDLGAAFASGMPESRLRTLRELVASADQGTFPLQPLPTLDQSVAALGAHRGIGPWTAQYVAMRAFRMADAFPAGDLALQKAFAAYEGGTASRLPNPRVGRRLEAHAERWRPYRAYAAMLLWSSS